jgi:hypothetical protein
MTTSTATQPRWPAAVFQAMTAKRLPLIVLLLGLALATCVERSAPARPAAANPIF